jgi:hypothetical protein
MRSSSREQHAGTGAVCPAVDTVSEPSGRPGPMSVRLEARHLYVGYAIALTSIASFVFLWGPNIHQAVAPQATGKSYLVIGLLLASLLAAATATRRRMLTGLAAMLLGMAPWGPEYFLQILVFAFGIWHLVQVARVTRARGSGPGAHTGGSRLLELARSALGRAGRLSALSAGAGSSPAPHRAAARRHVAPKASKRYTPPAA